MHPSRASESGYPATWYADGIELPPVRRAVPRAASVDVCVVGGGLAGLTATLELARRGRSVLLLEAHRVGWGASGRNGGFVSAGFADGQRTIVDRVGLAAAVRLNELSVAGVDYVREAIETIDPSIRTADGWMVLQRHHDAAGLKSYVDFLASRFSRNIVLLDRSQIRESLRTESYRDGFLDRDAFHIHPLRYCLALAAAAERAGATILEGCRVLAVEAGRDGFRLATASGSVRAGRVVACTSAFDRRLFPQMGRAVLPVATYVGVTERLGDRAAAAIRTSAAISDTRRAGDYYRRVDGDRILWGGRITTMVREPRLLAEKLKGDMVGVYPQLEGAGMAYAWSGQMAYALHKMPIIGEVAPGQWVASAFGGHGLNTTAMAGVLLARAIAEGDDEWRRFQAFGRPWVGGWAGRAGVQLSYWQMQVRDWRDERRARRQARRGEVPAASVP